MRDKVKRILQMIGVFAVVGVCAVILPKEAANAATVYEVEDNGSYATANYISAGDEMVGRITDCDDCDYYKVTPGKSGALTISFKHTYEDSYVGWDVSLVHETDGNYETLCEKEVYLYDNEKITFPFVGTAKNDNYYITVQTRQKWGSFYTGAEYKIVATFAASDKLEMEANNTYATANTIKLGETYKGVINNSDDKDYYKIVAPENGKIDISFKHTYADSYAGWTISLVHYSDGSYEELSSCNVELSDNEKIVLPFIGAQKGDVYYVVIQTRDNWASFHTDAEYKFTTSFKKSNLIEKENNNSYATATKVELNKTYSGIINQSGDKDYYKLEISTPGTLSIKFGHEFQDTSNYWNVYIYEYINGEYRQIVETSVDQDDGKIQKIADLTAPSKTNCYVVVEEGSNVHSGSDGYKLKISYNLYTPSNLKAKKSDKSIKLSWNKSKDVSGYEVYYKTSKNGKYKKLATTKSNSYTLKKASSGTTYYFKVRAYKKSGNKKYYSGYTNISNLKM